MAKRGRKLVWNGKKLERVEKQIRDYTDRTPIPMVSEFAYEYDLNRTQLYEYPELSDAIKRLKDKKETALQRLALSGKIPPAFAIFSLKQLGWRDKPEEDSTGDAVDRLASIMSKIVGE